MVKVLCYEPIRLHDIFGVAGCSYWDVSFGDIWGVPSDARPFE
jgi:hypothetical protein